jgi:glyoxylase-like metal-dependent hydrolase (beta-lactamase superfamily II)
MANSQESALHYPLGDQLPEVGHALDVAPGVRWLRMPLPFALDHINLWLLRDQDEHGRAGWTIVDCGIANDTTRVAWEQVFARELQGLPVLRVIVTHMHPDHIGLAHWLTERWGVRLWISATDWYVARVASSTNTGFGGDEAAAFMASHGLTDPDSVAKIKARSNYYGSMVPKVPSTYRRLIDGQLVSIGGKRWRCHAGYGHAPEHMAMHCEELGVLISGDMVLPRISTNVSVIDIEPEGNPLPLYLDSIESMRQLPSQSLVLPSHGRPFVGLHTRIDQLHAHHAERLAEVLDQCAQRPFSAAELIPVMFKRELDLHQTTFAMGEAIAHVHLLWQAGQVQRSVDREGVYRFSTASAVGTTP